CGVEPLPIGAARLVDVDMGVDNARRDHEVAGVVSIGRPIFARSLISELRRGRRARAICISPVLVQSDARDFSILDVDRGWTDAIRQDDSAAAYYHRLTSCAARVSRRSLRPRAPRTSRPR